MAKQCDMSYNEEILITMDNGKKKVVLCPNHSVMFSENIFQNKNIVYARSELPSTVKCEICGDSGGLYRDGQVEFHLCSPHLFKLIRMNLEPNEFKALYERVGDVYILHGDFYDKESGQALTPLG